MNLSLNEFGRKLDDIDSDGSGSVNEGADRVVVSGLQVPAAKALVGLARQAALDWSAEDDAGDIITELTGFDDDLAPYRLTFLKPANGEALVLFTMNALRRSLERDVPIPSWKHVQSSLTFSTAARRFATWEDRIEPTHDATRRTSPRELVRESGEPTAPARIGPWLLDMPLSNIPDGDPVFDEWAKISLQVAVRSLATEILADGTLVYAGPPKLKVGREQVPPMSKALLIALQRALRWVFETDHQAEIRHGLMGAELGRHVIDKEITASAVSAALEGAKIAYQLSLSAISKDSLKAIADVRKAVTEEINKTADTARQLTTAVAGAVFLGLGVVAARMTSTAPPILLILLSVVLAVYVGAMIFASSHFMNLQENLRSDWKQRFFGFLGTEDYQTLVTDPLDKAKQGFIVVCWSAGLISIAMVVAIIVFVSQGPGELGTARGEDPLLIEPSPDPADL